MGYLENKRFMRVMGYFQNKRYMRVKRRAVRELVISRIQDEMNTGLTLNEIKSEVNSWDDIALNDTPEGTIVSILMTYWFVKENFHKDDESLFNDIDKFRNRIDKLSEPVAFPRGDRPSGLSLEEYVIYRIRLEKPELHSPEHISDSYLRKAINAANEFSTDFAWGWM